MIIRSRTGEEIAPFRSLTAYAVITTPGSTSTVTHRSATFTRSTAATYHYEYLAGISNGTVTVESESTPDSVDVSEFPVIQREEGINATINATFTNGRASTYEYALDFVTHTGGTVDQPASGATNGSLLKYTADIVDGIAAALTTNSMWDSSGNRAQTSAIPHSFLTGHVWNGYASATASGAGITPDTGRRFMAITPRHLYGCGHYTYQVGDVLQWKDINNNIISRTVLGVINIGAEVSAAGLGSVDMSITLLSSALPETITILPVVGDWATGYISSTTDTVTKCPQIAGFTLMNNNGHIAPFLIAPTSDVTSGFPPFTYQGIDFSFRKLLGAAEVGTSTTIKSWPAGVGQKFYHNLRGGDSGSPCVVPCSGGWAYSGHISSNYHPTPALFNQLISLIDTRYGVSTGYTVTVAADPTL